MDNSETLNKDLLELDEEETTTTSEEIEEETTTAIEENEEEEVISTVVYDDSAIIERLDAQNSLLQQNYDVMTFILVVLLFMLFKTYVVHIWEHIKSIGK